MKDPAFLAEVRERKLDVDPLSGQEVEALIRSIFAKPESVVAAAKEGITRTDRVEIATRKQEELAVTATLDAVKGEGRVIVFRGKDGTAHEASVSASRTRVTVGGKAEKRAALAAGMTCEIRYAGHKSTAGAVICP